MRARLMLGISLFFTTLMVAKETTLIDYAMQDQFDQEYTQDSFIGKYIILFGADRKGSQFSDRWGNALRDSLSERAINDSIQFVSLANLDGVPALMKGMVKRFFPKEKDSWALMDWDGLFASSYDFAPDQCNILVFDKEKNLLAHKAVTDFEEVMVSEILKSFVQTE